MKNMAALNGGFEKMGAKRRTKKDKAGHGPKSSPEQQRHDDYEEYFNVRYGNKLYR